MLILQIWLLIWLFSIYFYLASWFLPFLLGWRLNHLLVYYFWRIRPYFRCWDFSLLPVIECVCTSIYPTFLFYADWLCRLCNIFCFNSFNRLRFISLKKVIDHRHCLVRYLLFAYFWLLFLHSYLNRGVCFLMRYTKRKSIYVCLLCEVLAVNIISVKIETNSW